MAPPYRLAVALPEQERVETLKRLVAAGCWVYAALAAVVLTVLPPAQRAAEPIALWVAAPLMVVALAMSVTVARARFRTPGVTSIVCWIVAAFCGMSLVACLVWNLARTPNQGPVFSYADAIYLAGYALLTVAYALIFVRVGGSFRRPRTWLDATTLLVALLGAFWAFLIGPLAPAGGQYVSSSLTLPYTVTLAVMMTMGALVFIQLPRFRTQPALMLLIAAGLVDAAWEFTWVADWLTDSNCVGQFYNYGDVLCFCLVCSAAALTPQRRNGPEPERASVERSAYNFLPAMAALLAIALLAGSLATTKAPSAWILVGLVVFTFALLITRQRRVRRELSNLNRELARRHADARLTELVRCSSNLILVVDGQGLIRFASPAAGSIVGTQAENLSNTPIDSLFGPAHEQTLRAYFQALLQAAGEFREIELLVASTDGSMRALKLSGANRLSNSDIGGVTVTCTDVSEQRALERKVLDIATEERVRIAGDIHDGLGQELAGIALLLQCATNAPDPDPGAQRRQLQQIVTQLNQTVAGARDLARGLSPIEVVRGSLGGALQRLGHDVGQPVPVRVHVDTHFDEHIIDHVPADHLYRIAREAVLNAARHSGCTAIDITLSVRDRELVLGISDDGCGFAYGHRAQRGVGLQLMEYRARFIGGEITFGRHAGTGVHIEVVVPLRHLGERFLRHEA